MVGILALMLLVPAVAMSQAAPQQQTEEYQIGPRDVVVVAVIRHPEFSGEFLVTPSGIVDFPGVGPTTVTGLSTAQLQKALTEKLKSRLKNPEVSVTLKTAIAQQVMIGGPVRNPGAVDARKGWKLSQYINAVGGLSPPLQASDCRIALTRMNGDQQMIDMQEMMRGTQDPVVLAGDTISVVPAELITVYVAGQVNNPGMFQMRNDKVGLLQAITLAGGVKDTAMLSKARVVRPTGDEVPIDLSGSFLKGEPLPKSAPSLQNGDLVLIPESQSRFVVLGYVNRPGFFPLPEGRSLTLSEAIATAQGQNVRGRLSRVALVRIEGGKEKRTVYDLGRFMNQGDFSQNPLLQSGDVIYVPETDKFDISGLAPGISMAALLFRIFGK